MVSFDRYQELWNALDSAITEMQHSAADLRKLSSDHQIRDFNTRYLHVAVMSRACFKVDEIAEKLETVSLDLQNALAGPSLPREVQEEYLSFNLNDPGWE